MTNETNRRDARLEIAEWLRTEAAMLGNRVTLPSSPELLRIAAGFLEYSGDTDLAPYHDAWEEWREKHQQLAGIVMPLPRGEVDR